MLDRYDKLQYKRWIIIPVILLILGVGLLFSQYYQTGEFFKKSIEFKGGTQVTFKGDFSGLEDIDRIESDNDIETRFVGTVGDREFLVTGDMGEEELEKIIKENGGRNIEITSVRTVGPALGESFWSQSRTALVVALVFMAMVVFLVFRKMVPSFAVIFAAASDILITLGVMQLLGLELSMASFAGLLLILGYSIDTDILLTTRLFKRSGDVLERSKKAMRTGFMMTFTTIGALAALYFFSMSSTVQEIATVLLIALIVDIPNTYLFNLGILRWWLEK